MLEKDAWNKQIAGSPLHKCGWALQERPFSPRKLKFIENHVIWECESYCKCRIFPEQASREYTYSDMRTERLFQCVFHERLNIYGSIERPAKFHNDWVSIVSMYTSCRLTWAKDKLVAVGGLAEPYLRTHWRRLHSWDLAF